VGIARINISDLSPELQEEIKKRYVIDESGFILPYENDKNGLSMRRDLNGEEPEE
jgi:hypothetical protein